ncbi:MAG: hypothetical protein VW080_00755 [Flavobacteriaceae bacterium]
MKQTEEITIRNAVDFLKGALSIGLRFRILIICFSIFGSLLGLWRAYVSKPIYKAELSYILESSISVGTTSALLGLANQLGLSSSPRGMSPSVLLTVSNSKAILVNTFLKRSVIDNKADFNLNHFIRLCTPKTDKEKIFIEHLTDSDRTHEEDSIIKYHLDEFRKGILEFKLSKDGVVKASVATVNEHFSKHFIDDFQEEIAAFFYEKSTASKKKTLKIVERKVDSLSRELNIKQQLFTQLVDGSQRVFKMKGRAQELKVQRDLKILNILYAEAVENLEVVRFDLMYYTPTIQVIDKPFYPLEKEKASKLISTVVGGIIGFICVCVALAIWQFYIVYWKDESISDQKSNLNN